MNNKQYDESLYFQFTLLILRICKLREILLYFGLIISYVNHCISLTYYVAFLFTLSMHYLITFELIRPPQGIHHIFDENDILPVIILEFVAMKRINIGGLILRLSLITLRCVIGQEHFMASFQTGLDSSPKPDKNVWLEFLDEIPPR